MARKDSEHQKKSMSMLFHGTPRLVCGIVLGIGTLVLLFFTVWMGALHKTFDYNGKR